MKQKLGILGGMGPQATISLYQQILNHTVASTDQEHLPTLIDSNTTIPDRTVAITSGQGEGCFQALLASAKGLEQGGCSALVLPCNASHYFVPRLQEAISVPIIHMIDTTVAYLKEQGKTKVAILGTDGTIHGGLYQAACEKAGICWVVPTPQVQKEVMTLIYDQIKGGGQGEPATFAIIDQFVTDSGCDSGILACTELSVYRDYHTLPSHYVDPLVIVARACIQQCGYPLKPLD